jgi:hypothetical protein
MPDITMCAALCARSRHCYRHEDSGTEPNPGRQSYFMGNPCIDSYECYVSISTIPTERLTKKSKREDTRND